MDASLSLLDTASGAEAPLRIVVSEAGQLAALKALVAQGIPMLQNPQHFPPKRRMELADRLSRAICARHGNGEPDAKEPDDGTDPQDEPGLWLEEV